MVKSTSSSCLAQSFVEVIQLEYLLCFLKFRNSSKFIYSFKFTPVDSRKSLCVWGGGITSLWQIFKTEMFIYQSKANLEDEKILFGIIKYLQGPKLRKMSVLGL